MIRAVIDTNVLVSAFISLAKGFEHSHSRRILDAIRDERLLPLTSPAALEELEDVLNRPHIAKRHQKSAEEIAELVDQFSRLCEFVAPGKSMSGLQPDPDDDLFLEIAAAGGADVIVSGDQHLLSLGRFGDVPILAPGDPLMQRFLTSDK